ncbi:MAG TPA: tetratricopeptide repeat protein [Thermoanaerobaculia bacterium]|nr:tetratricopeptide repeat protein [Thermoanaerobaculia bacterium]
MPANAGPRPEPPGPPAAASPAAPADLASRPGVAGRRRLALYLPLGLCLLTLAAFLPVLRNGFVNFDDPQYVYANPHVRQGLSVAGLRWALTTQVAGHWHPLTLVSHMLDVQLYGLDPEGHHLTSLLLHLANVLLLFTVLHRMTGRPLRSAAVAALFAVHPLRVESVAWVAGRKDLLSGLFWMLALAAYLRYVRAPSAGRYLLVAAAFAASLTAKATAVTLPAVLLLLDFWPLDRWRGQPQALSRRRALWLAAEKLPLFCLSAAAGVIAVHVAAGPVASGSTAPLAMRAANALTSYVAYLGKTLDPRRLAVFYPFEAVPAGRGVAAALALAGITALATLGALGAPAASVAPAAPGAPAMPAVPAGRAPRRAPYLLVGWLWYLVTLAPVIGVVQAGWQGMADRYTYLPSIGLFLAAVWGAADLAGLAERWRPLRRLRRGAWLVRGTAAAAAALVLLGLTAVTRRQCGTWVDSFTLFSHALEIEESYVAHTNVAEELRARGDRAASLAHYRAAVRLAPRSPQAHAALGNALRAWGQPAAALQPLRAALALDPTDERARLILAMALDDLGQPDLAIVELRRVLAYHADSIAAHQGLAVLLQRAGDAAEAAAQRRQAEALLADQQRAASR